jgi:hypothetical protein
LSATAARLDGTAALSTHALDIYSQQHLTWAWLLPVRVPGASPHTRRVALSCTCACRAEAEALEREKRSLAIEHAKVKMVSQHLKRAAAALAVRPSLVHGTCWGSQADCMG